MFLIYTVSSGDTRQKQLKDDKNERSVAIFKSKKGGKKELLNMEDLI